MPHRFLQDGHESIRMLSAAVVGWTATEYDVAEFLKYSISVVTLIYMVGKSSSVWMRLYGQCKKKELPADED